MKKSKKTKREMVWVYPSVIWVCPNCGHHNLHVIDSGNFDCIACGARLEAGANADYHKEPK